MFDRCRGNVSQCATCLHMKRQTLQHKLKNMEFFINGFLGGRKKVGTMPIFCALSTCLVHVCQSSSQAVSE